MKQWPFVEGARKEPGAVLVISMLLTAAVFVAGLFMPFFFAHGMLYTPVVLVALASGRQSVLLWVAALSFALLGVGWLVSPPAPANYPWIYVLFNRVLSFAVLLMVTSVAVMSLRYARWLQRARVEAEQQGQMLQIAGELGQLGAWSFDVRHQQVHWSPEVARLHGRPAGYAPSPEEALTYYLPSDQPRIQALFEACVRQGTPFDGEFRIVDVEGHTRWVRVVARPVRDARGEVVHLQGAFQDIGGHKAVERQLDESLTSWRRLAETMPMMVWTADQQGLLQYVSPVVLEYSGESRHAVLGDGWVALLHPADRERVVAAWQRAVADGDRYESEFRMRRHDGAFRWHLARAQSVQLQPDAPPVWYGTAIDIHDRLLLEHEARELAARYETVLESTTDAVIAFDEQWRFTVVNGQAEKLLQRQRVDLLGRRLWDEFPSTLGSRFQQEYERCARDNVVVRFEERYAPLGALFEVTAYPSQTGGVTVYFRDVTEPRRVAEQLRQMQRLEAIGQLTGGVAHDFNNLLTVVMGNAELLGIRLPQGSAEAEMAHTIFKAATRGADMTQRLLAFARKQALSPQPVDINRLVRGMHPLLHRALGEHITIDVVPGADLWPALVDPGQLENALLNLAINARDAMPTGGRLVIETSNVMPGSREAERHPGVKGEAYVMLAVSDTGHGMTPEVMQHLFEPFFTTKPKGQGTGLGLSMVHGFVKQSNGHIVVDSEPGKGTRVRLYLPRIDSPVTERGERPQQEVPLGRGECVLLVEDDEFVRHYAVTLLTGLGYRVVVARDGPQALQLLQSHPEVQLLFTDVVMPGGIGGRELADRAQALRPGLPVLFASGYADNGIVHQGRLDPGVLLLAKPYRRADLARRVRQAIDGTQAPP